MASGKKDKDVTPMMRQYLEMKNKCPDAILFFRLGDFYEMFFEDAHLASRELDLTLTYRNRNSPNPAPLAGVPHHNVAPYIAKLVNKGYKVAICEQVEDPALAKGIVKRDIVKIITPGTIVEEELLPAKENNYLAALIEEGGQFYFAYCDVSVGGSFKLLLKNGEPFFLFAELKEKILQLRISELIYFTYNKRIEAEIELLKKNGLIKYIQKIAKIERPLELVKNKCPLLQLSSDIAENIFPVAALIEYISQQQPYLLNNFLEILIENKTDFLELDTATVDNLELIQPLFSEDKNSTLLGVLDKTTTSVGGRFLKEQILKPLSQLEAIEKRLMGVDFFYNHSYEREKLREILKNFFDLERIITRLSYGSVRKKEYINLKSSLQVITEVKSLLSKVSVQEIKEIVDNIQLLDNLFGLLERAIDMDMESQFIIKKGFNSELDHYRELALHGKEKILSLEALEKEKTGIKNLKIKYNKVFGYFFEVSKGNLSLVPEYFIRKQTLVNAERFYTQELKKLEDEILLSHQKMDLLEKELEGQLKEEILQHKKSILQNSHLIARLDFLSSLAQVAHAYRYTKPSFNKEGKLEIKNGRHPVIERFLADETGFIPNDLYLDNEKEQIMIITGPNMSGKSTYIRQNALIVLLAHLGSFVPAKSANISVCDRIFTRIGASDRLTKGLSTFMVEMVETANILNNATSQSLIIFDEVGRGTSTYDGVSIAWAIVEYLHQLDGKGVKTLFATHYHELTELEKLFPRVVNYNIAVREENKKIIFLHKIKRGSADRSYGIEVARRAGIPRWVIERSEEILQELEASNKVPDGFLQEENPPQKNLDLPTHKSVSQSFSLAVIEEFLKLDLNSLTPLEALNILYKLQKELKSETEIAPLPATTRFLQGRAKYGKMKKRDENNLKLF
jgi:DNA mismatch repair protein MutS